MTRISLHFRLFLTVASLATTVSAAGPGDYSAARISPIGNATALSESGDQRLIEPTSPILGKAWSQSLREDPRHPEEIVQMIERDYPNHIKDIQLSIIAYFSTMQSGLDEYCTPGTDGKFAAHKGALTEVMTAAIPLEVLSPFHQKYMGKLDELKSKSEDPFFAAQISDLARETAAKFQHTRETCPRALGLNEKQRKFKKFFPGRWDRLIELNIKISSAEAPYPRIQFSLNGLTQFVYNEILKEDRLRELLFVAYDAEVDWLKDARKGIYALPFYTFIERRLMSRGFTARQALLLLAYSTRNMPSLDTQYGRDPLKALLLESYFWKFGAIRDEVTKDHLAWAFPDKEFKENPGFYHFATAALTACEVWTQGFSGFEARFLAFLGKFGYKVDKLMKQMKDNKTIKQKLLSEGRDDEAKKIETSALKIAKEQGFVTGLQAGIFGGRHGLKACQYDTEARLKRAKNKPAVDAVSDLATGEVIP